MDVEETQVSVKFVTKLPDQLKVPEEVLVSNVEHRKNTPTLCPGTRKNRIFVAECACKAHQAGLVSSSQFLAEFG